MRMTRSRNREPLTHDAVLSYFKLIYGELGQKLLKAFQKSRGVVTLKNPWWGKASSLHAAVYEQPAEIRLRKTLNPIEAAQELMDQLIEASGWSTVRQHLDHSGFENIETLKDSYRQSVKQAAKKVALAAELYLSGLSLTNEGADWVITVHDVSQGNYLAAIGFLPLLPASVGEVILRHGSQTLRVSVSALRKVKSASD